MFEQIRRFIDYNPIFCSLLFWFACLCFVFAIVHDAADGGHFPPKDSGAIGSTMTEVELQAIAW